MAQSQQNFVVYVQLSTDRPLTRTLCKKLPLCNLTTELKMIVTDELLTIKEASEWATKHTGKLVTTANISYLIQYGRIKKIGDNGSTQISKQDLTNYY